LEELATRSLSTKSAILRKAIALFDLATEAKEQNQRLGLFDQNRQMVTEIVGI
jgi:predicted transcriptional regulator